MRALSIYKNYASLPSPPLPNQQPAIKADNPYHLAAEHCRSRASVRLRSAVKVVQDTRIVLLVRARERNRSWSLIRRRTNNVNLSALHVELGTQIRACSVQRNQLTPQQVLSRRNAFGNRNRLLSLVRNQTVNTPFGSVECVLSDFEPAAADAGVRLCVGDFLEVRHDGAFVGGVDYVVGA